MRTVEVRITGRVQGVGYRAWTRDRARASDLSGWVKNLSDGSVVAHLSGEADAVARLLAEMEDGPPLAEVLTVETDEAGVATGPTHGFEVRR